MTHLFLQGKGFIFTRLVAITWHSNLTLQPAIFTSSAGAKLCSWIENSEGDQPIVLSCSGISTIEDHALSELKTLVARGKRAIVFILDKGGENLIREIASELYGLHRCTEFFGNKQIALFGAADKTYSQIKSKFDGLEKNIGEMEFDYVKKAVAESYRHFHNPKRLDSTPLMASGVLNARTIISDPKKFIWVSLLLADLFERVIQESMPRMNRILAVSLRGSPFAAAIRILADKYSPSLEIIDHIGPKHDVPDGYAQNFEMYGGEYVLVSDYVIGGTELKIARTYAMSQGAQIKNAIAIGSYLVGDQYDKRINLRSLVQIPELVPDLKYEFRV